MVEFGMPTLIETPTLEECAEICHRLGLKFIELNMNLPQYQPDVLKAERFKISAEKHRIYYTIHLDENLNPCDFNPYVAEVYRHTVRKTIEFAKELGIPILNMHLSNGVYFTLPDTKVFLFDKYREKYLQSMATFRDECERAIGQSGIKICVENCGGYMDVQKEAIDLLLQSPVFGLTFDIGHSHGAGNADEPFLLQRADRLCHMHMHDALGRSNHLPLGKGEVDLPNYLALADYHSCRVVLETKTISALEQSIRWLKSHR